MRRGWVIAALAVVISTSLGGCIDPHRPLVDKSVLNDSENNWVVTADDQVSQGWLGPKFVETEYRYRPPSDATQTPGLLVVVGIRTLNPIETADLLERTRTIVDEILLNESVEVDPDQEMEGERQTLQGSPTSWFSMIGTASSDAALFAEQKEVRALGEAWYDGRSKTHVVVVALAQTTTQGLLGNEIRDHNVWNELVGDADGTVGGAVNENGFIVNIRSHG